ncbi:MULTISPECIES: F0F1 ATP synthase subunit A [Sphingobacterium]|uniref:ATP synthase subunit a n=2 Tax=Sphingobacteriaceae TaxID=84566 RepID=A0ABV0BUM2_9SPHI|nr:MULTISPECIES: F0F1 ATP synthase subunit A [Sphingobacterium]MCS3554773.1 F-type H+-transporting ATPase subunit a [Sphingobacterium sp. JUb21]MCW2262690.1 F-type H+-transporting ATPase subunit a [Sphingobacterium kitahiroshimense]TCR05830.1 ATP synthase F0 subcomplex A subunit [Sphingobacterium sp. JUb20]TCR12317.1 ATP synthase F0 subcomplex A subunit [Sphingobacterium sp. JUb78]
MTNNIVFLRKNKKQNMGSVKKAFLFFAVILFAVSPFLVKASESHTAEISTHAEEPKTQREEIDEYIDHHLQDDHYFSLYTDKKEGKTYGFPLPVIIIDGGVKIFMSSEFDFGKNTVEKDGQFYKLYHGKIYKTDATGTLNYDEHHHPTNAKALDLSITKNVVGLILATVLLFWGFIGLAKTYKKGANNLPKGAGRVLEPLVLYVRDEMAVPNIGHRYREFMPYLLSVFFLILVLNLLGLTPLGFNVTGNISVTICLAIFTFLFVNIKANKDYWKHIFWMPGVPVPFKFVLAPIEVLGMFTKPFSLMVRLFANITAGHTVIMGLIAIVYVLQQQLTLGGSIGVSMLLTTFLMVIEILVAFLQAFIFTMLSSLFIGMAVEEHNEAHH